MLNHICRRLTQPRTRTMTCHMGSAITGFAVAEKKALEQISGDGTIINESDWFSSFEGFIWGHQDHRSATTLIQLIFTAACCSGQFGSLQSCDVNHLPQNNPTNQVPPPQQQHKPSGPSVGQCVAPHRKNKNWGRIKIRKTQRQHGTSLEHTIQKDRSKMA